MATKTEKSVEIPAIELVTIHVRIKGLTALITHRFGEDVQKSIEAAQSGAAKTKKPPRDPKAEFRSACYMLPDGRYGFPAAGIKRAMVSAGQRFADERGTELMGMFSIPAELLPLIAGEPKMRSDRVVLSGMSRTSSIAYRPAFDPWAIDVPLRFVTGFITPDQIVNLLRVAGFSVGIGDWRVEKKGSFGQFVIEEVRGD